ncbi:MAG: YraN family protein [Reichenbachiella sp.]
MTESNQELGQKGEDQAVKYLIDKGYEIVCRNYRYKRAEIDIISKRDNCMVFVEVKLRSSKKFGHPEESVSNNQKNMIISAAEEFLLTIDWQQNIRFDIIAIDGKDNITQFEDAFH